MERGKGGFYRFKWFWNILRNGLFWYGVRNRLEKIGLDFEPYYWELEGMELGEEPAIKGDAGPFSLEFLKFDEIKTLANDLIGLDQATFLRGIEKGQRCIALRQEDGAIAAYMQIETESVEYKNRVEPLAPNEAYLLGMYTYEKFRGKNLAPYLRYKSYELLHKEGKDRLYSITTSLNKSSLKFKKKLGVRHLALRMHIGLFKTFHWNFLLKKYPG